MPDSETELLVDRLAASPLGATSRHHSGAHLRRREMSMVLQVSLVLALFLIAVATLSFASFHAFAPNADGATVLLQGISFAHGNVMLSGWSLSLDPFWLVDVPVYAAASLFHPPSEAMLHLVPSVVAAVVTGVGIIMARGGRRGVAPWVGGLAVFCLLALPVPFLAQWLTQGPLHVTTALWCLLAFAGLRKGRFGLGWVVAVVLLAAGMLGDLQTVAYGVVPAFVAGIAAALRTRRARAGMAPAGAAVVAVVVAEVVRQLAKLVGSYKVFASNPIATPKELLGNLGHGLHLGVSLFGLVPDEMPSAVPTWLEWFRVIGAIAVVAAAVAAALNVVLGAAGGRAGQNESSWRLDDLLIIAAVGSFLVYVLLTFANLYAFARYLTPAFIFGSILAGRYITRAVDGDYRGLLRRIVPLGTLLFLATSAASYGFTLTQPEPGQPIDKLTAFLESHHLHNGLGMYWDSNLTTVSSAGKVRVRPIQLGNGGKLVRYIHNDEASWYAGKKFYFLVYSPSFDWPGLNASTIVHTFGLPAHIYKLPGYVIFEWHKPLTISPRPGPQNPPVLPPSLRSDKLPVLHH